MFKKILIPATLTLSTSLFACPNHVNSYTILAGEVNGESAGKAIKGIKLVDVTVKKGTKVQELAKKRNVFSFNGENWVKEAKNESEEILLTLEEDY